MIGVPREPPQAIECLFIADTGDNDQVRREVTIYVVVEPTVGGSDRRRRRCRAVVPLSLSARADRCRGDRRACQRRPHDRLQGTQRHDRLLQHSCRRRCTALASGETLTAQYSGNTGIRPDQKTGRLVTAAAVSPDGKTLAVRTYYEVYFFGLVSERGQSRWRDLRRPCALGDAEPQGEAIDYLDANTLHPHLRAIPRAPRLDSSAAVLVDDRLQLKASGYRSEPRVQSHFGTCLS